LYVGNYETLKKAQNSQELTILELDIQNVAKALRITSMEDEFDNAANVTNPVQKKVVFM
jgi:hypothetical protein